MRRGRAIVLRYPRTARRDPDVREISASFQPYPHRCRRKTQNRTAVTSAPLVAAKSAAATPVFFALLSAAVYPVDIR